MAFYIACHNGAQYSLERGHKYLNSVQTLQRWTHRVREQVQIVFNRNLSTI